MAYKYHASVESARLKTDVPSKLMLRRFGTVAAVALSAGGATAGVNAHGTVDVPYGNLSQFSVALPEFGGKEAIIYRSSDGKRVAAAFHESGTPNSTYPFDDSSSLPRGP